MYVTGSAAVADRQQAGDRSLQVFGRVHVIVVMLLLVYRPVITSAIMLTMVVLRAAHPRGAWLFAVFPPDRARRANLLVVRDRGRHALFLIGRYQEARAAARTRVGTMFGGTRPCLCWLGSDHRGATFCPSCRLPYFQTLGVPLAIGMVIVVARRTHPGPGDNRRDEPVRQAARAADGAGAGLASGPPSSLARPHPGPVRWPWRSSVC